MRAFRAVCADHCGVVESCLTQCIDKLVFESQLPHKTVHLTRRSASQQASGLQHQPSEGGAKCLFNFLDLHVGLNTLDHRLPDFSERQYQKKSATGDFTPF